MLPHTVRNTNLSLPPAAIPGSASHNNRNDAYPRITYHPDQRRSLSLASYLLRLLSATCKIGGFSMLSRCSVSYVIHLSPVRSKLHPRCMKLPSPSFSLSMYPRL